MIFTIDRNKPIPELDLHLAKPNEEIIGNLMDADNRHATLSFGRYNEITLEIPKYVYRKHKRVLNKNYTNILERYLVKADYSHIFSEWMIVTQISKIKGDIPKKKVTLKSRQYELNDKFIRNYEVQSYTPRQVMTDALRYTNWIIGIIDSELEFMHRAFSETKISVLNMLFKIAETFGGILVFDTFNRTVSLRKQENVELDFGLTCSYGKYLKTVEQDSDAEAMTTRLYVFGKDNLSINEVNPTGVSYIEDFSYFMQGYKTDENGNVISSSPYMSDSLCQAILDYNEKLTNYEGVFKTLLDERKPIQEEWVQRLNEYYQLEMELIMIEDRLDINKAAGLPVDDIEQELSDKQAEIDGKLAEIDDLELELTLIENDILDLRDELALTNNFTPEQLEERNYFIIEGEWTDKNYFDPEELYEVAKKKLAEMKEPKKDLNFTLIQFLEVVEAQRDWDKIGLGYVIRVDYEPTDIEFKAIITELKIGFDNRDLNITVSNVDYKSNRKQFAEFLYKTAVSTSQKVDMGSLKWNESANKTTELEKIIQGEIDATERRIKAGVNESIEIGRRGIILRNPDFPSEMVILQSGGIFLSEDGGKTWKTTAKASGVLAERLVGRLLVSQNLYIENDSGTYIINDEGFRIESGSLKIIGKDGTDKQEKWDNAEQNAKNYIDEQIGEVNEGLDNLNTAFNNAFSDDYLTSIEANNIKISFEQVLNESNDLIIVADSLLIEDEKENYSIALTALELELEKWIDLPEYPVLITEENRRIINSLFNNVQDKKSTLINKITEVQASNALKSANTYTNNQINEVNKAIDDLDEVVTNSFSDEYISSIEAETLDNSFRQLVSESTDLIAIAVGLEIVEEKNNYSTALDALETELNKWINQPEYPIKIEQTDRDSIKSKFSDVQNAKSILINKISAVREQSAKTYADNLKEDIDEQINTISGSIGNLEEYIDETFHDGIIEEVEAINIRGLLDQLNINKVDLDNQYNAVYNNEYLKTINVKLALETAKNQYNVSYSTLVSSINDIIEDGKVTEEELIIVNTNLIEHNVKLGELTTALQNAIDDISENRKKETVDYIDNEVQELNHSISGLDNKISEFSNDNKLTLAEANSLKTSLASIKKESVDILAVAESLEIVHEADQYSQALMALENELIKWIDKEQYPIDIEETDRNNIITAIENVQNAKSVLVNKISSVQAKNAQEAAEQYAYDNYEDTKNTVNQNKEKWNRASFLNEDGTLDATKLKGLLSDNQIASAEKWNGQGTYIDENGVYTGALLASQIIAGNINTDEVSVGNDSVTINKDGVTVKDGSFYLEDDTSDTKYSIVPKTNLLGDHSFEMVERTGSVDLTYGDFAVKQQIESFGKWRTVGSPRLLSAHQTDWIQFSLFYHGLQAIVVSSTNYVEQHFPYIPGKTYTVSAYFTGSSRSPDGGYPRIEVRLEDSIYGNVRQTWSKSFDRVYPEQDLVRYSLTFNVPADADNTLGGDIVVVSIKSAGGWVVADGVQVVEGNNPVLYDPENGLWNVLNGVKGFEFNSIDVKGEIDSVYANRIWGNANNEKYVSFYNSVDGTEDAYLGIIGNGALQMRHKKGDIRLWTNGTIYFLNPNGAEIARMYDGAFKIVNGLIEASTVRLSSGTQHSGEGSLWWGTGYNGKGLYLHIGTGWTRIY